MPTSRPATSAGHRHLVCTASSTPSSAPRKSTWDRISVVGYFACQTCIMFVAISRPAAQAATTPAIRRAISTVSTTQSTPSSGVVATIAP